MSLNQSRVERAEQHTRKSGRSSGPGHQRGFHNANAVKSGAAGAGSSAPPPPSSSSSSSPSASANRSFKKSNGQGGQSRVSNTATNSEANISRGLQNGTLLHNQKPVVPLPGPSGMANPDVTKQVDHSHPKNAQPPRVPTSHSGAASSESTSTASPSGDASKMFPLQFGTITPGFMNGMQIPARTSSAPPNLDEQKRDQTPVPPQTSSAKPSVLPLVGGSISIPFQQPQVTTQYSTPNSQQSQSVSAGSLQMPLPLSVGNPTQVQQPLFVHGLQSHPLQAQGMIHQSQGLGYAPQMNHQLGPQLGNMGISVAQFPQPTVNKFVTPRKAVKITDPKTHEELRLDKRTDSFTDTSSSGQTVQLSRSHAAVATQPQQPIPSFSSTHPINYYTPMQPNSYTPSIFYAGQPTHTLANAQVAPGSSATRYGYPVSHGGPTVSVANPVTLGTSLPQSRSGPSSQATSDTINVEVITAPAASVQVTVKPPPTGSLPGKVGSSTSTPSGDSSSGKKGAVVQTEPVKMSRHQESGASHLQRSTEGARLISSAMGEILAQSSSTTVSSAVVGDAGPRSCIEQPKSASGMPSPPNTLHATVKSPASSAATVEERQLFTVSSVNPITLTEDPANILTNPEARKWDPLKKSDSFKDQQKLNRKELQQSESENQICNSAGKLKSSSVVPSKISEMNAEHGSRTDESKPGVLDGTLTSSPRLSSFKLENSRPSEVVEVPETKDDKTLLASSGRSVTELEVTEGPINSETTNSIPSDAVPVEAVVEAISPVKLLHSDPSEVVVTIPKSSVSGDLVPHDLGMRGEASGASGLEDSISKTPTNLETQENMSLVGCSGNSQSTDASLHQVPVVDKVEEISVQIDSLKVELEDTVEEVSDSSLSRPSDEALGVDVDKEESLGVPAIASHTVSDSAETENLPPPAHLARGDYEKQNERESKMSIEEIESPAESTSSSRESATALPEGTQEHESSRGSENLNSGVSPSTLSTSRDKMPLEQSRPKSVSGKKKKKRELLSKADAAGTTADLYMAYKTPEEKRDVAVSENVNTMSSNIDGKQMPEGDTKKHASSKEEDSHSKSELDDWEEAAEISSPKLKTLERSEAVHSNKCCMEHDSGSVGGKRYTRDFLMTISEQCKDLPAGFGIGSDIADLLINVQVNASFVDRDAYHMGGRIFDRQPSGSSRLDRRGSGNMEEDRWNKLTAPFVPGRTDLAYGIAGTTFRQGPGGNLGVLKNPRGHPGGQYVSGILSGPVQSLGSPGGLPRMHADADRWLRAPPVQKGLIPSPHAQPVVMHKAEKRYEVGKVSDEEETKQRQLKSILNKLTPQNFEKLFGKVKEVNIDNVVTLTGVISQIFDKALMEPTFCEMYADFCSRLAGALPDLVEGNEKVTFRRLLLNKCQEEFERGEKEEAEADKDGEEGETKQSAEEREAKRIKARRRMLGNIRLIGELYKKKMLTERIMHECIKKLLGQYENPDEEDVEALCKLMSTIGAIIDHPIAKEHMDAYFDRMYKLSTNQKLSSRMRFMLRDTIDLRKNKWQQRRKVEGPKKIEEVHRDAAQERQTQSGRASRGSGMSSSARRGQAIDYGPRGSTGLSSPGSQPLVSLRGMPASGRFGTQDVRLEDRHIIESRTLSVPLPQRSIDDDSITLGPQGGLAKGMSMRGQPSMSSGSVNDISVVSTGDARRMGMSLSGSSSTHSLAEWTPNNSREEVGSRGVLLDRPKSAHSYGQPNHEDRVNRDARNTPVSSTGAHNSIDKLPEEQLREKSISAIKEFYSANDEEEVASCVKELNAPNFYPTMVSLWVTDSFERKNIERDRLTKLLVSLCKSRNHLLSQRQLINGFEYVFATLSDAIYDAPKAPEFLGGILAKVILENIISLKDVGRLIHEGGEEPGSLTESGIASDVLGSILEVIKEEKGDTVLKDIRKNSEIRLEEFLPPDPRKQAKLIAFI
ncbi:Eukaryotic translation initiation factor 4G [Nymphaea thermarum]|nr:Eukaryotic translation initiation factor 4G [Nymphaea thermarum]